MLEIRSRLPGPPSGVYEDASWLVLAAWPTIECKMGSSGLGLGLEVSCPRFRGTLFVRDYRVSSFTVVYARNGKRRRPNAYLRKIYIRVR